MTADQWQGLY